MKNEFEIADDIYWIGVKDNSNAIFENLWPLDNGVTYNAYLCVDEQITLIDCVENDKVEELLQKHSEILPDKREIDFLIINHIEPDHSGGIAKLIEAYPNIKIVGNKATFKFLEGYYHIHDNLFEVKNNTVLKTGKHSFRFISTPMLHWPETMMTFHETSKILFSGDAFGSFGQNKEIFDTRPFEEYKGEFVRYFSNVLGKYNKNILKALSRIEPLQPGIIASTHGPVWKQHLNEVISLYYKFAQHLTEPKVMVLYASMYGNTEKLARHIYQSLEEKGVQVSFYNASTNHLSYILSEAFLSQGIIVGAPTYNGEIFPWVDFALQMMVRFDIRNRYVGIFGSKTWSSGITQKMVDRVSSLDWELVHDPFENLCAPTETEFQLATAMADKMAQLILKDNKKVPA